MGFHAAVIVRKEPPSRPYPAARGGCHVRCPASSA